MANRQNKSYLLSKRKKGKAFLLQNQEKMPSMEQKSLKFRYEDFVTEDIPNLMINIWWYSDEHGTGCDICTTYKKMCVQALKKKWSDSYKDVNEVIQKLKKRDKQWCNISRISSAERHYLYWIITK